MSGEIPNVVGQEQLLDPKSPLMKSVKLGRSIVLVGFESSGKTLILEGLAIVADATRVEARTTASALRKALAAVPEWNRIAMVTGGLERFDKEQQEIVEQYIDSGGVIFAEARSITKVDTGLVSRFSAVRVPPLTHDALARIITSTSGRAKWDADALETAVNGIGGSGRHAANIGAFFAKSKRVTEKDARTYLGTLVLGSTRMGAGELTPYVSWWIKEMRLGNVYQALYIAQYMRDMGIGMMYLAERLLIFAADDTYDANAYTVGLGVLENVRIRRTAWEPIVWGTQYMCTAPKWWESEEGRKWQEIVAETKKRRAEEFANGIKPPPIPSYALDKHTSFGRARIARGEPVDNRFTGAPPGRRHMAAYFKHHGKLDPDKRCVQCEKAMGDESPMPGDGGTDDDGA